ncbi:unnamed protein product [Diamesa tonsa]
MSNHHIQTLTNSIIGTAILAMPYCFKKCGVILAILLIVSSSIITRLCCHYLIKASIVTRRRNFESLGFHIFGSAGKLMVELSAIGYLMGTGVAYFVVIGDLSPLIVTKMLNLTYDHDSLRKWSIVVITIIFIAPLSFQKNIQSLSFVCKASIGFYICLTLKTFLECYELRLKTDDYWLSNIELWNPSGILQCIPIFSMALSCQLQLFDVYETMGNGSLDRINKAVRHATTICMSVYIVIGFFGYVAFYNKPLSGNILVNFSPSLANDVITIGFVLSIACSFPLVMFPCRASLASLLQKRNHSDTANYIPEAKNRPLTVFIIVTTMILGILVPSVEVVVGLLGSTIGVCICILFPSMCLVKLTQKNTAEKFVAQGVILIGFAIMILGTYANLNAMEVATTGSHLEEKAPGLSNEMLVPVLSKDVQDVVDSIPDKPPAAGEETVKVKDEEVAVQISDDGIKKEDQEIAVEKEKEIAKEQLQEISEKNQEIKELKKEKEELEKEVKEIKEVLVKQNIETQQLVLQKFDEIAEKVDKIEKKANENKETSQKDVISEKPVDVEANEKLISNSVPLLPADDIQNLAPLVEEAKDLLTEIKQESIVEPVKPVVLDDAKIVDPPIKPIEVVENVQNVEALIKDEPKLEIPKTAEKIDVPVIIPEVPVEPIPAKIQLNATRVDPIVKTLKDSYAKLHQDEPLSYQMGEKIMEAKHNLSAHIEDPVKKDDNQPPKELHNEIRKRRDTDEEASWLMDNLKNEWEALDIKSMALRDLKSTPDEN